MSIVATEESILYDNLNTSTLGMQIGLQENYFDHHPLQKFLYSKRKMATGGRRIELDVRIGKEATGGVNGMAPQPSEDRQVLTKAFFDWGKLYAKAAITRDEMEDNTGSLANISLVKTKYTGMEESLKEDFSSQLFDDGVVAGFPKPIVGLGAAVSATPTTGIYGGIDRADVSEWRNGVLSGVKLATYNWAYLAADMKHMASSPADQADMIIMDKVIYNSLYALSQGKQQIQIGNTPQHLIDMGFTGLQCEGAPVMWDNDVPTGYIYFLRMEYVSLYVSSQSAFKFEPWIQMEDRGAKSQTLYLTTQLVVERPNKQSVRTGVV